MPSFRVSAGLHRAGLRQIQGEKGLCVANIHDAIEKFTSMPVLRKEVENVEAWFRREEEERAGCDAESAAGAAGKEEAEDVPSQQEEIEQVDCEISDM
eukprot:766718-Hanusia_phi.AAC.9